jgi:hypothetical protein
MGATGPRVTFARGPKTSGGPVGATKTTSATEDGAAALEAGAQHAATVGANGVECLEASR